MLLANNHLILCLSPHVAQVLDAPGLNDDFYVNTMDWSRQDLLCVALRSHIYVYNVVTAKASISILHLAVKLMLQAEGIHDHRLLCSTAVPGVKLQFNSTSGPVSSLVTEWRSFSSWTWQWQGMHCTHSHVLHCSPNQHSVCTHTQHFLLSV